MHVLHIGSRLFEPFNKEVRVKKQPGMHFKYHKRGFFIRPIGQEIATKAKHFLSPLNLPTWTLKYYYNPAYVDHSEFPRHRNHASFLIPVYPTSEFFYLLYRITILTQTFLSSTLSYSFAASRRLIDRSTPRLSYFLLIPRIRVFAWKSHFRYYMLPMWLHIPAERLYQMYRAFIYTTCIIRSDMLHSDDKSMCEVIWFEVSQKRIQRYPNKYYNRNNSFLLRFFTCDTHFCSFFLMTFDRWFDFYFN